MTWHPATMEDIKAILDRDLKKCDDLLIETFKKYAVKPYLAPIKRHGNEETLVVVARKNDEVIYWEDIEEGFNISPIAPDGRILEHWCNQDELCVALRRWI